MKFFCFLMKKLEQRDFISGLFLGILANYQFLNCDNSLGLNPFLNTQKNQILHD